MRKWVGILLLPLMSACVSNPPAGENAIQTPVSQQADLNNAGTRARAHVDLGMQYLQSQRTSVALDEARRAIEADSGYPLGYNLLGLVQMMLGESGPAEASFRRALELAPGDPEIENNYGWFLCQGGREKESIPHFVTAADAPLNPRPTKPWTNAGICSLSMKDDAGAEVFLHKAMRADPTNMDAQFLLADICYRTGRLDEARARLSEVHRRQDPTSQTTWLGLRIERKLDDREAQSRYASEMRQKFRNSREYRLLQEGKFE